MNDVDFPGWRPEKSIQVVEGNGRTQVIVTLDKFHLPIRYHAQ